LGAARVRIESDYLASGRPQEFHGELANETEADDASDIPQTHAREPHTVQSDRCDGPIRGVF
jgi:hypothetical protein